MLTILGTQKLLTPTGHFKPARNLTDGDLVLTSSGSPVHVKNVHHIKSYDDARYYTCHRSKWWSSPLWIQSDQKIATSNGKKRADKIDPNVDLHLFPAFIEWNMPHQTVICYHQRGNTTSHSYALGYILGAFMVCGAFNEANQTIKFKLPPNNKAIGKIYNYLQAAFPSAPKPVCDDRLGCIYIDSLLYHVFEVFDSNPLQRTFPSIFLSSKPIYMTGVYDGIIDITRASGVVSQAIYELALVASIIKAHRKGHMFQIPFVNNVTISDVVYYGNIATNFEIEDADSVLVDTTVYHI